MLVLRLSLFHAVLLVGQGCWQGGRDAYVAPLLLLMLLLLLLAVGCWRGAHTHEHALDTRPEHTYATRVHTHPQAYTLNDLC